MSFLGKLALFLAGLLLVANPSTDSHPKSATVASIPSISQQKVEAGQGRFAYCLVVDNEESSYMAFGKDAQRLPDHPYQSTPATFKDNRLILELVQMQLGGNVLNLTGAGNHGTPATLDMGTSYTYLPPKIHTWIRAYVERTLNMKAAYDTYTDLYCFPLDALDASQPDSVQSSPYDSSIFLVLGGGAKMEINPGKYFVISEEQNKACLGVRDGAEVRIGSRFQNLLHIVYDDVENTLSFTGHVCVNHE